MIIKSCAERLASVVPPAARRDLSALQRSAERASSLTREALTGTCFDPPARSAVDLNDVVTRVVDTLSCLADRRIRVRLLLTEDPAVVIAAPDEVEGILLNLALNACDAMGGAGTLTLQTAVARPHVRLTVMDTGCGLTPDVQQRMFEPFFTTKPSGMGLGLSSVAFTVERLHGSVSVASVPGRGTTVAVVLPFASQYQL